MTITRSVLLLVVAALVEIGGAWMVWQAVRENRGWLWAGAGSLAWGMALDGFRPDRYDVAGVLICLVGVAVNMYSPRST